DRSGAHSSLLRAVVSRRTRTARQRSPTRGSAAETRLLSALEGMRLRDAAGRARGHRAPGGLSASPLARASARRRRLRRALRRSRNPRTGAARPRLPPFSARGCAPARALERRAPGPVDDGLTEPAPELAREALAVPVTSADAGKPAPKESAPATSALRNGAAAPGRWW